MKKWKVEWLAAVLVVLVMGVVLVFLLLTTFNPNHHEVSITLPDESEVGDSSDEKQRPKEPGDDAQRAKVTAQNVQNVIKTLERPQTYAIYVENVVSYQEESRVMSTRQWVLEDACVTQTLDSLTGRTLCALARDGVTVYWYEGDDRTVSLATEATADMIAGIPTYEDILELDMQTITVADYREWEGYSCIYVESYDPLLNYTNRYYVSDDLGLLVHAETYTQGELVYSMSMLEYSEDTSAGELIVPPS